LKITWTFQDPLNKTIQNDDFKFEFNYKLWSSQQEFVYLTENIWNTSFLNTYALSYQSWSLNKLHIDWNFQSIEKIISPIILKNNNWQNLFSNLYTEDIHWKIIKFEKTNEFSNKMLSLMNSTGNIQIWNINNNKISFFENTNLLKFESIIGEKLYNKQINKYIGMVWENNYFFSDSWTKLIKINKTTNTISEVLTLNGASHSVIRWNYIIFLSSDWLKRFDTETLELINITNIDVIGWLFNIFTEWGEIDDTGENVYFYQYNRPSWLYKTNIATWTKELIVSWIWRTFIQLDANTFIARRWDSNESFYNHLYKINVNTKSATLLINQYVSNYHLNKQTNKILYSIFINPNDYLKVYDLWTNTSLDLADWIYINSNEDYKLWQSHLYLWNKILFENTRDWKLWEYDFDTNVLKLITDYDWWPMMVLNDFLYKVKYNEQIQSLKKYDNSWNFIEDILTWDKLWIQNLIQLNPTDSYFLYTNLSWIFKVNVNNPLWFDINLNLYKSNLISNSNTGIYINVSAITPSWTDYKFYLANENSQAELWAADNGDVDIMGDRINIWNDTLWDEVETKISVWWTILLTKNWTSQEFTISSIQDGMNEIRLNSDAMSYRQWSASVWSVNYKEILKSKLDWNTLIDLEKEFWELTNSLWYKIELIWDATDNTKTPVIHSVQFFK